MKKAILVFLSVVGLYHAQAQSTFSTPSDTVKVLVSNNGGDGHSDITPVGSGPLTILWKVKSVGNLPTTWFNATQGFGICDNVRCYTYFNDPGISDVRKTNPITAGDAELKAFKITFEPNEYPAGGPYYVTATLTDENNPSSNKDVVFAIQKWATSVSGIQQNSDDITVYPNPARAEINVLFNGAANVKNIAVYNLIGKVVSVYKVTGSNAKLDISNIPSGIYFMRLVDNSGRVVATRKFTHQ